MADTPDVVRIMLVDDHAVVRAGYRRFLEQEPGYRVIAEAAGGDEAYALLKLETPDIVILDLSMPGRGGLSTIHRLRLRWPLLPVLVCSMHDNLAFAVQALRAGANGYVTKSSEATVIVSAVRRVISGETALSPDIAKKMEHAESIDEQPTLGLTVREFEVFRLIASGRSHEEIASLLKLSAKTVANNHSLIRQKLGINSDIELFRLAVGCGAVAG
jgi:DNA-binding NarL/FixJ family response regulator